MNGFEAFWVKIGHGITDAFKWLFTKEAKTALDQAAELVGRAAPIVETIGVLVPTGAIHEVVEAYLKYGVEFSEDELSGGPLAVGSALLQLATIELKKIVPNIPINIIQTAIQMAVTAYRANHPTTPAPAQ